MYYLLFAVLFAGIWIGKKPKKVNLTIAKKAAISITYSDLVFGIELALIWGLLCFKSESVGIDTSMYRHVYEVSHGYIDEGLIWNWKMQPLYYFLFGTLSGLKLGFRTAQLLIYTFSVWTISFFCKKYAKEKELALYLWVCMESLWFYMSGIRQMISVSVGLLCFDAIIEKKKAKAILLATVSVLFHKSAVIIFLALVLLFYIPSKNMLYMVGTAACMAILVLPNSAVLWLANFLDFGVYGESVGQSSNFLLILIYIVMCVFFMCFSMKASYSSYEDGVLAALFFLCVLIMCASGKFFLISREAYYFTLPLCVTFSNVCERIRSRKHLFLIILICTCFAIYYFKSLQSNVLNVVPYHFFWNVGEAWV